MKKYHNYDNYPYELKEALKRSPANRFVLSCVKFFIDKQFLSAKQKEALSNVEAPEPYPRIYSERHGDGEDDIEVATGLYGFDYCGDA